MSYMPKPPRTSAEDHWQAVDALQRWLWACAAAGWSATPSGDSHWTHDDNIAVQPLGWMLAVAPGTTYFDLFSLYRRAPGTTPAWFMKQIIANAPVHPLCNKALGILTASRLQNPDVKFAFMEGLQ